MCLATPMKIDRILEGKKAIVTQGNVSVQVDVSLLENPRRGIMSLSTPGLPSRRCHWPKPRSAWSFFAGWRS